MMDFAFAEHQTDFRDAVRGLLEERCRPSHVRAAWESESGIDLARWNALAQMGVVAMMVPESLSGLGLGETDFVLVLEESGRALLPEPLIETAVIAPGLLKALGGWGEEWLERVGTGGALVGVGLEGPVLGAQMADLLLVCRGDIYALEPNAVGLTPRGKHDRGRRLFDLQWNPSVSRPVLTGSAAEAACAAAFEHGAWASAAQLLGVADRLVEMAATHARERVQFGRPIGSFQAVKHLLADIVLAAEFARPAVYAAAWALEHRPTSVAVDVSLAKALASEAALAAAETSLQVHGAIGYTWEHDLHMWLKRARSLSHAWGDAAFHRERIAAHLGV